MFLGFVTLGDDLTDLLQTVLAGVASDTDFMPSHRIYGPDPSEPMLNSTGNYTTAFVDGQTGLFSTTHAITEANGYERGKTYTRRALYTIGGNAYPDLATFCVV